MVVDSVEGENGTFRLCRKLKHQLSFGAKQVVLRTNSTFTRIPSTVMAFAQMAFAQVNALTNYPRYVEIAKNFRAACRLSCTEKVEARNVLPVICSKYVRVEVDFNTWEEKSIAEQTDFTNRALKEYDLQRKPVLIGDIHPTAGEKGKLVCICGTEMKYGHPMRNRGNGNVLLLGKCCARALYPLIKLPRTISPPRDFSPQRSVPPPIENRQLVQPSADTSTMLMLWDVLKMCWEIKWLMWAIFIVFILILAKLVVNG